tara:strand:- start:5070 stop:5912 length:843 start_codon:yes stop_codon:yes gene_type:complete
MENWLIGTDYEFGISKNGEPISIVGKIGGTKNEPLDIGNGCARQEDNVNAEVTQPPVNNFKDFVKYIEYGLTTIKSMVPGHDLNFNSLEIYSDEELNTYEAQVFGCESSFDVYARGLSKPAMATNPNLRSAGFHIHFGNDKIANNNQEMEKLVKLFDKYVTIPSMLLDPEKGRRELYGRAGEFRMKSYGLECRQLGSFFLSDFRLIEWVWEGVQKCITQYELGEDLNSDSMFNRNDINNSCIAEDIINGYDLQAAKEFCDANDINYLKEEICKELTFMVA